MPECFVPCTVQKAASDAGKMTFSGTAAVYGRPDDGRDYTFAPGAFDAAVQASRQGKFPAMLLQHGGWDFVADDMLPLGIWTELSVDDQGLKVEGKLANTTRGRDVHELLKMDPRPAIDGLSIGFRVPPGGRQEIKGAAPGEARWLIQAIDLLEISVVTFPAMTAARVTRAQSAVTERDLERRLVRDAWLSRREARALLRQGKAGLDALRDAGEGGDEGGDLPPDQLAELARLMERNLKAMKG